VRLPSLAAALLAAFAFFGPLAVPATSAPTADPKIDARAKDLLGQAQAGNFDRSQFTSDMSAALSDTVVANVKAALAPLGTPNTIALRAHYDVDGNSVYLYRLTFKDASWNEQLALGADGKITGLYFRPAPPAAATSLPGEDPAITARARAEFLAWQSGQIDRAKYAPTASDGFNDALVARVATELTAMGAPNSFIFRGKLQNPAGAAIYAYLIPCANSAVWMTFGLDSTGKIAGIAFQPE
jgi:hypothetical protein